MLRVIVLRKKTCALLAAAILLILGVVAYKDLIRLKKNHPALQTPDRGKTAVKVHEARVTVEITRWDSKK